jgi:hypothetical protein
MTEPTRSQHRSATEPAATSATAHLLDELALFGHRPGQDEPDPRPLPEVDRVAGELDAMIDSLAAMLADTRLEDDQGDLLWALVNIFHRKRPMRAAIFPGSVVAKLRPYSRV